MSDSSFNTRPFGSDSPKRDVSKPTPARKLGSVRPLFDVQPQINKSLEPTQSEEPQQTFDTHSAEAQHVVKRLLTIIEEHRDAASHMSISLNAEDLTLVTNALKDHAKGGKGILAIEGKDEVLSYCLTRLYEELVEEPSNILYTTKTGKDTVRYDAMEAPFWIACLNLLEQKF